MCGALSCSFGAADKAPHWSAECSENQAQSPPAVTLLQAVCDGAVVGWGRWADVGRARGCCGPWFRRRPRRFAPAALGDCGARPAAAARCACCLGQLRGRDGSRGAVAPAACGDFGVGANRGLILFREVNDLIWTPEALAYFDRHFLRFCCANPAVLRSKGVDAPGLRFYSFTSRETIHPRFCRTSFWAL